MTIMEECIPRATIFPRRNLPWMSRSIRAKIRKRNSAYKKARETGGTTTWKKYTSLRNQVVHTLRQAKKDHLKKVSSQGSKQFWKTVKVLKKASSQIPTLNNGSIIASTNVDKAGRGSRQQGSRSATPQTNPNSNSNTGRRRAGNGNRNRGHGGTNSRGGASHQDGRVQPNPRTGEPPKTNSQGEGLSSEGPSTQTQTDSQRVNGTLVSQNNTLDPGVNTDTRKVRVSGVRRIWGTVKSCSSGAVKNTVSNLVSPWMSRSIRAKIRKRNSAYKKARETGGTTTWKKYTSLRNQVVHTLRQAKKDHLKKVSSQGSKQFWKTVKVLKKASSQIPTLNNGSIIASTNVDKAGRGSRQQGSRSATPQTNLNSNSNTGRRRAGNGKNSKGCMSTIE